MIKINTFDGECYITGKYETRCLKCNYGMYIDLETIDDWEYNCPYCGEKYILRQNEEPSFHDNWDTWRVDYILYLIGSPGDCDNCSEKEDDDYDGDGCGCEENPDSCSKAVIELDFFSSECDYVVSNGKVVIFGSNYNYIGSISNGRVVTWEMSGDCGEYGDGDSCGDSCDTDGDGDSCGDSCDTDGDGDSCDDDCDIDRDEDGFGDDCDDR